MEDNSKLERGLNPRHVEMIALGSLNRAVRLASACSWARPARFRLPVRPYCSAMHWQVWLCSSSCVSWAKCSIWNR